MKSIEALNGHKDLSEIAQECTDDLKQSSSWPAQINVPSNFFTNGVAQLLMNLETDNELSEFTKTLNKDQKRLLLALYSLVTSQSQHCSTQKTIKLVQELTPYLENFELNLDIKRDTEADPSFKLYFYLAWAVNAFNSYQEGNVDTKWSVQEADPTEEMNVAREAILKRARDTRYKMNGDMYYTNSENSLSETDLHELGLETPEGLILVGAGFMPVRPAWMKVPVEHSGQRNFVMILGEEATGPRVHFPQDNSIEKFEAGKWVSLGNASYTQGGEGNEFAVCVQYAEPKRHSWADEAYPWAFQ